jgi:hypothetical protein
VRFDERQAALAAQFAVATGRRLGQLDPAG